MEQCRKNYEGCPARLSKAGCRLVMHHLFYPERKYVAAGPLAEEFRNLPEHRVPMCAGEEIILHQEHPQGPPIPSAKLMEYVVDIQRERRELAARPLRKP